MSLYLDSAFMLAVFLIATRLAGVFLFSPVLGFSFLPARIRVAFVLMLAWMMAMIPGVTVGAEHLPAGRLMLAFLSELMLGAALGFAVQTVFGALAFAGQLADLQIGFGAAVIFNPATQVQSPLLSVLLTMSGACLFLVLDGHHELIRGLADSLQAVPPGHLGYNFDASVFIRQFGVVFVYGFAIAAPVVLGLMLVDIAIAVVARTMPQINIYFVTLPMKIFIGLSLFALSLAHVGPLLRQAFVTAFEFFRTVTG